MRFDNTGQKNEAKVRFTDTLSLSDSNGTTNTYHLRGVIYHIGEKVDAGHYTALVKRDEQWVLFDDEAAVTMQSNAHYTRSKIKQSECYMALYHL